MNTLYKSSLHKSYVSDVPKPPPWVPMGFRNYRLCRILYYRSTQLVVERAFSMFFVAFTDNAMEAKIELFEQQGPSGTSFTKVFPQPSE